MEKSVQNEKEVLKFRLLDLYFDHNPKNGRGILLVKYFGDNYKKNYQKDFEHCNPPIMKIIVLVRLLKLLYKKN